MPIHYSHPNHEISLTHHKNPCDGCKMDGHGERYRCSHFCNYDLHKECIRPDKTLTLNVFPDRTFEFLDRPPPGRSSCCGPTTYCGSCKVCDMCGMTVKGFVHHCREGGKGGLGLEAHPRCAMLKKEINAGGVVFKLDSSVQAKCNCCKRKKLKGSEKNMSGFNYVLQCKELISFHVYCLMGK